MRVLTLVSCCGCSPYIFNPSLSFQALLDIVLQIPALRQGQIARRMGHFCQSPPSVSASLSLSIRIFQPCQMLWCLRRDKFMIFFWHFPSVILSEKGIFNGLPVQRTGDLLVDIRGNCWAPVLLMFLAPTRPAFQTFPV